MQIEGRTFGVWCTMCSKASVAQVSLHYVVSNYHVWFFYIIWHSYNFIWRLSEAWHNKRPSLVEAVKFLLDEQNLGVRKALSEVCRFELWSHSCRPYATFLITFVFRYYQSTLLSFLPPNFTLHYFLQLIVVMASHCYLVGPSGELFVEYLVRHCALTEMDRSDFERSKDVSGNTYVPFQYKRSEVCIRLLFGNFNVATDWFYITATK